MNKGIKYLAVLIITVSIFFGCTDKKNPVGTNGQHGPLPIETEISAAHFSNIYSFEDSLKNYNSDKLVLGNYNSNETDNQIVTLIKFTSLVDTFYQEITNSKIVLRIKEKHNFDIIDNTNLKIGKIITNEDDWDWYESTATWKAPTDSTTWKNGDFSLTDGDDFELLNDLNITLEEEDSLTIELPNDLVEEWILEDSLNYGLALFTEEDNAFIELYSSENDDEAPKIYFDYQETVDDTVVTVYKTATHDINIGYTDYDYQYFENRLIISDIQPIRMIMKFDISADIFTDADPSAPDASDTLATELYLERLTINRAYLVLAFDSNLPVAYPIETGINIDPYILISDTLNLDDLTIPLIGDDNYEDLYITSSYDSLNSDAFKINITSIVQNLVSNSEEYENYGIMLRSLYESYDLKHTEFIVEPKIEILFTPPYLEE